MSGIGGDGMSDGPSASGGSGDAPDGLDGGGNNNGGGGDGGGNNYYNSNYNPAPAPAPEPIPGMFESLEEAGVYGSQQAYDLYNLGAPTPYAGSGIAGFGADSNNAFGQIRTLANQGNPYLAGATQQVSDISTATNPYIDKFNNSASASDQYQQGFMNQSTAVNPFLQGFNDFSGQQNQFLDAINERGMNDIQDRLNSQFGGSGRSNSIYHTDSMGRSLGDYSANLYGNAYEGQQNRNLQALVGGSNAYNSQTANQLNALNQGNTQRTNAMQLGSNAYNSQISQQLEAAGMLPGLNDAKYDDARMLMGLGQTQDYMAQMQLDDKIKRHDIEQNSGWNNLQNYMNVINGLSPTQQPPQAAQQGNDTLDALATMATIFSF